MAKESGNYTDRDLTVMRGLATEVCYFMVAYNGDLLQVDGSNPSGHNLTVYINSIVNSLLFRCGFASIYGCDIDFRSAVALSTYGDDAESTVKVGYDEFNHISFAAFLKEYGMVFTMPDKTSDPVPYMNEADTDFLKRRSHYIEEIDCTVGKLDEMSIYKSLHRVTKSKSVTMEEVCGSVIDSALVEWFYHGREVYDDRREKLMRLAQKYNLNHYTSHLEKDFDDRVKEWKLKYLQDAD
jgi:hypothetical protein